MPVDTAALTAVQLARIADRIQSRLAGRVGDFRLSVGDEGVDLAGWAVSHHVRQLAQQAVMEVLSLPIRANLIDVTRARRDGAQRQGGEPPHRERRGSSESHDE